MKVAIIILGLTLLSGCAMSKECKQVREFFKADSDCPSGYLQLEITGHAPTCADQDTIDEIRKQCGGF